MSDLTPQPESELDSSPCWALLRLKPHRDDDAIDFLMDDDADEATGMTAPWSILVVDDDDEVHRAVDLALMAVKIKDRPLLLSHCNSATSARSLLLEGTEPIDLVLLDVVMETADAGLTLLDEIRALPAMRGLPVLLHTGQPGHAPEQAVRLQYDISGYLTKSTVTRQALIQALDAILGGDKLSP